MNNQKLMTPQEVANFIGVSVETLNVWRATRRYRLSYIKVGRLWFAIENAMLSRFLNLAFSKPDPYRESL